MTGGEAASAAAAPLRRRRSARGTGGVSPGRSRSSARERLDRIYTTIRDRICLLDYAPGTRLSEEELASEFKVSRTPIRRALSRLEAEELVEIRHGVGNFVTDVDEADLKQVFQLRMELAVLIGRLDPLPRGPEDLARMEALLARCDRLAQDPEPRAFARLNMDFFLEFDAMIGNRPLRELTARLYYQTSRIWLKSVPHLNLGHEIEIFRREMAETLAVMQSGDLEAVGHIRRHHISMSVRRMLDYGEGEEG
ncbi:transcriptional regulator, GntR family [Tistlia consotensis]|uniref:Transcriptional regulator, GntR family n=1 Tax=Tistlia consotensis USBA 355 TaxID=560819 RepID=A0A1Y6CJ62_9PROT|nr:GntR family transcriptional regulator [Tistlia consotensis]SMF56976.1 transcriptional regulator, GntR family [Tistlia consotensis USBA 355]SNR45172.1 transcriptional regulator, GntR family [Tistlia consotensis]